MKLPFVSRSTYDDAIAQRDDAQAQVKHLTNIIIDMKVTGATVRQATTTGLKLERKPADPIERALDENPRTRTNAQLRRGWRNWADKYLGEHGDTAEAREHVLDRIANWNRVGDKHEDLDDDDDDVIEERSA